MFKQPFARQCCPCNFFHTAKFGTTTGNTKIILVSSYSTLMLVVYLAGRNTKPLELYIAV